MNNRLTRSHLMGNMLKMETMVADQYLIQFQVRFHC
jgi:hypothetical protein